MLIGSLSDSFGTGALDCFLSADGPRREGVGPETIDNLDAAAGRLGSYLDSQTQLNL